jgi:hypothetical protein
MANIARIDHRACSGCGLSVTFVRERGSISLRYDMAAWGQQCQRKDCDGPMSCPFLGQALQLSLQDGAPRDGITAREPMKIAAGPAPA